jgi:hypothetical protein
MEYHFTEIEKASQSNWGNLTLGQLCEESIYIQGKGKMPTPICLYSKEMRIKAGKEIGELLGYSAKQKALIAKRIEKKYYRCEATKYYFFDLCTYQSTKGKWIWEGSTGALKEARKFLCK